MTLVFGLAVWFCCWVEVGMSAEIVQLKYLQVLKAVLSLDFKT